MLFMCVIKSPPYKCTHETGRRLVTGVCCNIEYVTPNMMFIYMSLTSLLSDYNVDRLNDVYIV